MRILLAVCLFMLFSAHTCSRKDSDISALLFRHWVHSFEDDTPGIQTFRPAEYDFPLARGREGFEIKQDGQFIRYKIAPTDGTNAITGTWKLMEGNKIQVSLNAQTNESYFLDILSVDGSVLKIKK